MVDGSTHVPCVKSEGEPSLIAIRLFVASHPPFPDELSYVERSSAIPSETAGKL